MRGYSGLIGAAPPQVFGTATIPYRDTPLLEVPLPDAAPEPFQLVLDYIYTDKIDPTKRTLGDRDSGRIVPLMMDVYRLSLQVRTSIDSHCRSGGGDV